MFKTCSPTHAGQRRVAMLLCCFAMVPWAAAQNTAAQQVEQARKHGAAALQHLRNDDIEKALEVLGQAADLSLMLGPGVDDGLSAAAGALHRALMQLSEDERFDLLYEWSLPSGSRREARLLTTIVPQAAPPKAFARLVGERPRDESFAVSAIGGVRGLFSTGWSLVLAAEETGRLRRLTTELERLAEDDVPNSDVLLLLAKLARDRSDSAGLSESLQARAASLEKAEHEPGEQAVAGAAATGIDASNMVLAAAALTRQKLRPLSERIFNSLTEQTYGQPAARLRPFLRLAHATAVQLNRGRSGPEILHRSHPKYWVATSGRTSLLNSRGAVDAVWIAHEDHVLHLAGAHNDTLFLRYPLTGDFEFTCETQEGGLIETDGGLVYGGLQYEARGATSLLTVWDADAVHSVQRACPFVRHENRPTFNRVSIRSHAGGAKFLANLHPVWHDDQSVQQSPWLGLRSFDERRPLFRNLTIRGSPVIPRQVRMSDGDHLRGWQSHFLGETQASQFDPAGDSSAAAQVDWSVKAGVVVAPKGDQLQSLLRYQRPLLDGEAVAYEFHYQRGRYEVHPALGRLAFLLEPGGVRVHWITDGSREWTGLPADNALLEALNRRGARQLPLKENDWNAVKLARRNNRVTLSLNAATIYERSIDFGGDHLFGLFLNRTKAAAKVRHVVMTGDWPETLPEEFLNNPAVAGDDDQLTASRRTRPTPALADRQDQ